MTAIAIGPLAAGDPARYAGLAGPADKIGGERLFPTLPTAVDAYEKWSRQHGPSPGREEAGSS